MNCCKGEGHLRSGELLQEIRKWLCKWWEGGVVDSGALEKNSEQLTVKISMDNQNYNKKLLA